MKCIGFIVQRHPLNRHKIVFTLSIQKKLLINTFLLPESCWEEEYYKPLESRYADFLERHNNSDAATQLVAADQEEIDFYRKYKSYYGYAFYIAKKP